MRLSVAVMHEPRRAALLPGLLRRIRSAADVVEDRTGAGPWPTARRAWESTPGWATHRLVLQDDVALVDNFGVTIRRVVEAVPDRPIALFCPRPAIVREAHRRGHRWVVIHDGGWAQGFVLPTIAIGPFLAWQDRNVEPTLAHDDARLSMWLFAAGGPAWATVPSLVEHRAVVSLIGHDPVRAADFPGEDADLSAVDWSPPSSPYVDRKRRGSYWPWWRGENAFPVEPPS
jgi:hypothetical protein